MPATAILTTATRSSRSCRASQMCCHRAAAAELGDGRQLPGRPPTCWPTWWPPAGTAHWLNPEPKHLWGSIDSAVPLQEVMRCTNARSAKRLATVIDQLLPVVGRAGSRKRT